MDPPIHTEYFLSGGAMILILMVEGARAVWSTSSFLLTMILVVLVTLLAAQTVRGDLCAATYSCISCTEVKISHNTPTGCEELMRFTCPSTTPYCNSTGDCSSIPSLGCGPTDTYPCMRDGVFPDPSDCSKYHVCVNGTSYAYTCPTYYNFNSDQGTCVRGATCYTFNCYSKSGSKVPYTYDAKYYAYCRDGTPVLVDSCPGAYKLDTNTQMCGPVCQAEGNKIPDQTNCTRYFYCSKEPYASVFTATNVPCPTGYGFDPRGLRCIPLKMLPTCTPTTNY